MRFTKMQGLGNDYVYVNGFDTPLADPARLAPLIADRHFGVGGDGLIVILPSTRADCRMRMFNADGSEAQMCGNGLRCVAKFVWDHGLVRKERLTVETGAGVLALDLTIEDGRCTRVRVGMGRPELAPARIPARFDGTRVVDEPLAPGELPAAPVGWREACGWDGRLTCVALGNPHAVCFCADVAAVPLEAVGPALERHPRFPERINVHFVEVIGPRELRMRTWERGSGVTLACGTGASAVAVAAVLTGRGARELLIHLPGGDLELAWPADPECGAGVPPASETADPGVLPGGEVFMTGPAVEVFTGESDSFERVCPEAFGTP